MVILLKEFIGVFGSPPILSWDVFDSLSQMSLCSQVWASKAVGAIHNPPTDIIWKGIEMWGSGPKTVTKLMNSHGDVGANVACTTCHRICTCTHTHMYTHTHTCTHMHTHMHTHTCTHTCTHTQCTHTHTCTGGGIIHSACARW